MIIVKLMGGLGNQMFQYAAARRLSLRHQTELKLDLSFLEENTDVITQRKYELGQLNIRAGIATAREVAEFTGKGKHRLARMLGKLTRRPDLSRTFVREPSFDFWPGLFEAPDNSYLEGYWQTEKYFKEIADVIREEFLVLTEQDQWNLAMAERIKTANSVSIHVRRGDYVSSSSTNEFHGTCSLDYYRDAVAMISEMLPSPSFFVFSDEPEWVKANLELPENATYMDHNPPDKGCEDLRLIGLCRHCIIANSSFSWWGAWLGNTPGKTVIAPRRWFNVPDINTDDLIPEAWIRI